jgi:hypothetical protein
VSGRAGSQGKGTSEGQGLKPLPSPQDYQKLKVKHYTTTVEALISDGYATLLELGDEMQSVFDSMPENLQFSDLGERRQEAADALSNLSEPDVPEGCGSLEAFFLPSLDLGSRAKRATEAADMLRAAAAAIREKMGDDASDEDRSEWESLADQLDSDVSDVEEVEFPGMYG